MLIKSRLILTLIPLVIAVVLQEFELRGASASNLNAQAQLQNPLGSIPLRLGNWIGTDIETTQPQYLYGDSHLHRFYRNINTGRSLKLWIAHSATGEDRFHHPEVCMRATGHRELANLRSPVNMKSQSGKSPAQHFVFEKISDASRVHVVYWHYALAGESNRHGLLLHGGLRESFSPPSITVEVFADSHAPGDGDDVREFSILVNKQLDQLLPGTATRGSERKSYIMIRDAQIVEG